jgi:hypothetical protein
MGTSIRVRHCGALVLLVVAGFFTLSACTLGGNTTVSGSGQVKSEQRKVSSFNQVSFSGAGQLTITQGSSDSLTVVADENLLPYLTSSVSGNTQQLGQASNVTIQSAKSISYLVTVKQLQGLTLSGAGTAEVNNVTPSSLNVTVSGAGHVRITGSAASQNVTLSGVGSYDGSGFATKSATVDISGTGNAVVAVSDTLTATVSGIGSVEYIGNPKVTQHVTGLGGVRQQ